MWNSNLNLASTKLESKVQHIQLFYSSHNIRISVLNGKGYICKQKTHDNLHYNVFVLFQWSECISLSCHFISNYGCHDCHCFSFHMIRTPLSSTLEHSALVFKEQEVSTKTSDGLQGNSNDDTNFKVAMITMFHWDFQHPLVLWHICPEMNYYQLSFCC